MRSNIATIPCPKCKRPNPVESRICGCGYWFMKEPGAAEQRSFPAMHVLMPDIQSNLTRKASVKTSPQYEVVDEDPVHEIEAVKPETVAVAEALPSAAAKPGYRTAEERGLPIFKEITAPGKAAARGRHLRLMVSLGTIVLFLIAAGVWGGAFERFRTQQPASSFVALPPEDDQTGQEHRARSADSNESTEMAAVNTSLQEPPEEENAVTGKDAKQPATTEKNVMPTAKSEQRRTDTSSESTYEVTAEDNAVELVPVPATPKQAEPQPKASNKAVPVARCNDGTYSYRSSRGEVCGQRGGVAEMLGSGGSTKSTAPAENRTYVLGPRGGCYYLSKSGAKVYVDKKFCN